MNWELKLSHYNNLLKLDIKFFVTVLLYFEYFRISMFLRHNVSSSMTSIRVLVFEADSDRMLKYYAENITIPIDDRL